MKRALTSMFAIALAGFIFSTGITLFQEAVQNIQGVLGKSPVENSIVACNS